jgi:hypothetical protein
MSRRKSKEQDKKTDELRDEAKIGDNLPGRNTSEKADIEQTRIENRREADLEDKTPGGDGGPEDNNERQANDPIGESNLFSFVMSSPGYSSTLASLEHLNIEN